VVIQILWSEVFKTQSSLAGNYGLSSAWTNYRGGYLNNDVKSKDLKLQAANISTEVTQNDITLQMTQASLNILLAKRGCLFIVANAGFRIVDRIILCCLRDHRDILWLLPCAKSFKA